MWQPQMQTPNLNTRACIVLCDSTFQNDEQLMAKFWAKQTLSLFNKDELIYNTYYIYLIAFNIEIKNNFKTNLVKSAISEDNELF